LKYIAVIAQNPKLTHQGCRDGQVGARALPPSLGRPK